MGGEMASIKKHIPGPKAGDASTAFAVHLRISGLTYGIINRLECQIGPCFSPICAFSGGL